VRVSNARLWESVDRLIEAAPDERAPSRRQALRASIDELRDELTLERGETWGSKVRRSGRAVRNAFVP
jgi:hypothetical protein